jgi:hypothetical protein
MSAARIEFSLVHGTEDVFPPPFPANKVLPDWFKGMPAEAVAEGVTVGTVKNCPPFMEAMTCGYIIPLAADVRLSVDPTGMFHGSGPTCYSNTRFADIVTYHRPPQVMGAPFEKCPIVKIFNPWLIRTPPGYSALFQPVMNRFMMPLYPLSGLVETDIFYREVNFPCVLTVPPGTTLTLRRGTPLVQVIPIKREEFESETVPLDAEQYKLARAATLPEQHDLHPESHNFYKNNYWRKKSYR